MNKFLFLFILLTFPAHADMNKAKKHMANKDYQAAFTEYLDSAKKGNLFAQYIVAQMYARGEGVKRQMREAASWYSLAADRGHMKSQNNLANMYMDGYGVLQNLSEAARWFKRAADQGNYLSMASLAELYQHGDGVEQDFRKALTLYLTSARNGVGKSMNNLGFMHFKAQGVPQNHSLAYMWFSIAEYAGDTQGKVNKHDMRDYLDAGQKSQAELAAQAWLTDHPDAMPLKKEDED